MRLRELKLDSNRNAFVKLKNGDELLIILYHDDGPWFLFQIIKGLQDGNRRYWPNVDELTAQCILNELLKNPLAQIEHSPQEVTTP